jgi:hypothetical protein
VQAIKDAKFYYFYGISSETFPPANVLTCSFNVSFVERRQLTLSERFITPTAVGTTDRVSRKELGPARSIALRKLCRPLFGLLFP